MTIPVSDSLQGDSVIRCLLGGDEVRAAAPADAIAGVVPRFVAEPGTANDLARILAMCNDAGLAVIARGGGTKIDWGGPPRGCDLLLSTRKLNRVIEHAAGDMTATVQAGCTVEQFQATLAKNGQRLAVDPLWQKEATIGGILATNDSGALRHAFGPLRDSLIGITVALADGTLARSGGKVVKNVAGYDLPKLFIGSFGTLGVMVEATFRLYPLAHASRTLGFSVDSLPTLGGLLMALNGCGLLATAVQIAAGDKSMPQVSVLVEGLPAALEGKVARIIEAAKAAGAAMADADPAAWNRRERMFAQPNRCVCRLSLLPMQWPEIVDQIGVIAAASKASWHVIGQGVGVGLLSLGDVPASSMIEMIAALRSRLSATGGSLVVLHATPAVKAGIDPWGDVGDALPLMRRIKQQFDPRGTLSPGRFVGGI